MRIGRLRHWINIEHLVSEDDGGGGLVSGWVPFAEIWAGVEPLRGQQRFEAQKLNPKLTHRIVIRYLAGITAAMRIKFGGRIFSIEAPPLNPDERNQTLELLCSEEAP